MGVKQNNPVQNVTPHATRWTLKCDFDHDIGFIHVLIEFSYDKKKEMFLRICFLGFFHFQPY